jgi:hypothetical protein
VQDDDFDVLPAHVDDDVRIFVELESRFRVCHRLDQRYVRVQNVFQDVFRVASGSDSENFQLCLLRLYLPAQILKHLNRVLNRISV